MELTIQKIKASPLTASVRRTLELLVSQDSMSKMKMVAYYSDRNKPKFDLLLSEKERLPDLVKLLGLPQIGQLIMSEVAKFVNSYTVVRPMNDDQISDCAMAIIQSSEEDFLSIQDLVIFFEGAKQGKYGRVLDHIDQHVIFEMLEVYRQQRHECYLKIKEEKQAQYATSKTALGRSSDEVEVESIREAMLDYYKKTVEKTNNDGSDL